MMCALESAVDVEMQERLDALVNSAGETGAFRYSLEDLYVVITYLTIQSSEGSAQLGASQARIVRQVFEAAGVREDSSPEEVTECMRGFFERNPPRPELLNQMFGMMRELRAEAGGDGHLSEKLADLVGAQSAKVLSDAPPPDDSTPAGPMAKFALRTKPNAGE